MCVCVHSLSICHHWRNCGGGDDGSVNLFFHFKVFVRWIFISVYLHIGDVPFLRRYRRPDSLKFKMEL